MDSFHIIVETFHEWWYQLNKQCKSAFLGEKNSPEVCVGQVLLIEDTWWKGNLPYLKGYQDGKGIYDRMKIERYVKSCQNPQKVTSLEIS